MAQGLGSPPLTVSETLADKDFIGHVEAFRDSDGTLGVADVLKPSIMTRFEPVTQRAPDFGYTRDVIWLAVRLQNTGVEATEFRLHFRENFLQLFEVYQVAEDASITQVTAQDTSTTYSSRRVQYPELVAPLTLPPGTSSLVLVRYWSGGSSEVSFQLMDADTFSLYAARKTAKNFIYYGMLMLLDIAAIIAFLTTGRSVFAAYAAYASFGLLFVMHGDGNAFQYLWPDAPGFNAFASVPLGTGLIVFGGVFARNFLQTRVYHPYFDKLIIGFMLGALALALSAVVWDAQLAKKVLVLFAFLSMVLYALSGFNAARTRLREVRFYVLAWTGAVVASAIMTARHWLGLDISEEAQFDAMRIVLVLDAALMGLAILDRINQLKRTRENALQETLVWTERSLRLSTRLRDLEQRYSWAVELAENRQREVADVVHDLRQPLHALRLSVQAAVTGRDPAIRHVDIEDTFGYLEGLVSSYLDAHVAGDLGQQPDATKPDQFETCDIGVILSGVADVHQREAEKKGLELIVVPTSLHTQLPPLAVMRIAANLVSNAVKYTETGKVLVGMRRAGPGFARLEVHDTGPGIPEDAFEDAKARKVRLASALQPEGSGLGLSIVEDLARQHGLRFERLDPGGAGTSLAVTLPVLPGQNGGNT